MLDEKAPKDVGFGYDKMDKFSGRGTCSAMALDFAARYFNECSGLKDNNAIKNKVKSFASVYDGNTRGFSSVQMAYDTVEVEKNLSVSRPNYALKQKMQGLSNFHGIELSPATDRVLMRDACSESYDLFSKLKGLSEGIYVIRLVEPSLTTDNCEIIGHTMTFVIGNGFIIFYNNSDGAIYADEHRINMLYEEIMCWYRFHEFRIYEASFPEARGVNLAKPFSKTQDKETAWNSGWFLRMNESSLTETSFGELRPLVID